MTENIKAALEFVARDLGLAKIRERKAAFDPGCTRAHNADSPRARAYALGAAKSIAAELASLGEGSRNQVMNDGGLRMGHFVGGGYIEADDVLDLLTGAALECGLDQTEINATLPRAIADGVLEPIELELPKTEQEEYEEEFGARFQNVAVNSSPPIQCEVVNYAGLTETDFWSSPIMQAIRQAAQARSGGPYAVLGSVLIRVLAATDPRLTIPPTLGGRASLNAYLAVVGKSGDGKGASDKIAKEVLQIDNPAIERKAGSGEGIAHLFGYRDSEIDPSDPNGKRKISVVKRYPESRVLFRVDEIDTLTSITKRSGGGMLLSVLKEAYDGAPLGQSNADASRSIPIEEHSYRLCVIAGVQPTKAEALFQDSDGGTPQRWVWLPVADKDRPHYKKRPSFPDVIPYSSGIVGGLHDDFRSDIELAPEIEDEIVREHWERQVRADRGLDDAEGLGAHRGLTKIKVAAAFAMLLDSSTKVTGDIWQMAEFLMSVSDQTRQSIRDAQREAVIEANHDQAKRQAYAAAVARDTGEKIEDRRRSEMSSRLVGLLRVGGGEGVSGSALRRTFGPGKRPLCDEVLGELVAGCVVTREEVESNGQKGARYRWVGGS